MLAAVPGIGDLATVKGEQISNVGSQDMSFAILLTVAKRINELAKDPGINGFVITHGTDTLEESAYFLNLTVKTDKPVVMVGSMRPSTAVSADGPLNLYNAVGVAADPQAKDRGVLVVMNDQIHAAHSLTKTSTTALETFMSPLRGLAGVASYGKNDFYSNPVVEAHDADRVRHRQRHPAAARRHRLCLCGHRRPTSSTRTWPPAPRGIIIAGVGNGNMNKGVVDCGRQRGQERGGRGAQLARGDRPRRPQRRAQRR